MSISLEADQYPTLPAAGWYVLRYAVDESAINTKDESGEENETVATFARGFCQKLVDYLDDAYFMLAWASAAIFDPA